MSFENIPNFLLNFSECDMNGEDKHFYRFKSFRLNVEERQLLHNNSPVPLTPKAFDVLALLVERSGHLVEKDELLRIGLGGFVCRRSRISRELFTRFAKFWAKTKTAINLSKRSRKKVIALSPK